MRFLATFMGLNGVLFIASSLTQDGLLPSGHGTGAVPEMILGVGLVFVAVYWLFGRDRHMGMSVNN